MLMSLSRDGNMTLVRYVIFVSQAKFIIVHDYYRFFYCNCAILNLVICFSRIIIKFLVNLFPSFAITLLQILPVLFSPQQRFRVRFSLCSGQRRNEFETVVSVGRTSPAEFRDEKGYFSKKNKVWARETLISLARDYFRTKLCGFTKLCTSFHC